MTAVVIPVKPGDDNPELRFTLRSIHAYVPDPDVWVVGYRPTWLHGVGWIPTHTSGRKSDRGCQQTRAAAAHPDTPERFWWWDDDMWRLAPLPDPVHHHGGPVTDWLAQYATLDGQYVHALRRTATFQLGARALFYDLHVPFWVDDKTTLAATMDSLPDGRGGWLWRTVHGNRHRLGGQMCSDVKVYDTDPTPDTLDDLEWLSADDASFPRLAPLLCRRFADPSPWEGPADQSTAVTAMYASRDGQVRHVEFRPATDDAFTFAGWRRVGLYPADQTAPVPV